MVLLFLSVGASLSVLSHPSQYVLFNVDVPSHRTACRSTRLCPSVVSLLLCIFESHHHAFIYRCKGMAFLGRNLSRVENNMTRLV